MGDRGNIELTYGPQLGRVYLYTHWYGASLRRVVAEALDSREGRARREDDAYLARIIFDHLVKDADSKETGYGIAPYPPDQDERPFVRVNLNERTVDGMPYDQFVNVVLGKV